MSRKSEAANMFEDEEDFDAAYSGEPASVEDDDEIDDEDAVVTAAVADDEADSETDAWAAAEEEEPEEETEEETEKTPVSAAAVEPEDYDDDAEESDDDSENDDDENDDEDDDEAEVSAAREIINRRNSSMAKKSEGKKTKAEMIRDEITRRGKAEESMRACDIIASLADEGVEVNASQVSVTLRNMGVQRTGKPGRPAGQKKEKAMAAPASPAPHGRPPKAQSGEMSRKAGRSVTEKPVQQKPGRLSAAGDSFTEADLEATAAFVGAIGTTDRGMTLLRIFSRLND